MVDRDLLADVDRWFPWYDELDQRFSYEDFTEYDWLLEEEEQEEEPM